MTDIPDTPASLVDQALDDQSLAWSRNLASELAAFYATLIERKIPADTAKRAMLRHQAMRYGWELGVEDVG